MMEWVKYLKVSFLYWYMHKNFQKNLPDIYQTSREISGRKVEELFTSNENIIRYKKAIQKHELLYGKYSKIGSFFVFNII